MSEGRDERRTSRLSEKKWVRDSEKEERLSSREWKSCEWINWGGREYVSHFWAMFVQRYGLDWSEKCWVGIFGKRWLKWRWCWRLERSSSSSVSVIEREEGIFVTKNLETESERKTEKSLQEWDLQRFNLHQSVSSIISLCLLLQRLEVIYAREREGKNGMMLRCVKESL